MTQIICRLATCLFWEQGICGAEEIEYGPEVGCATFQDMGDLELAEEDDDDEGLDWEEGDPALFTGGNDSWEEEDDDWEEWDEEDL